MADMSNADHGGKIEEVHLDKKCIWWLKGKNLWERICKCKKSLSQITESHGNSACKYEMNPRKVKGGTEYVWKRHCHCQKYKKNGRYV